MWIITGPFDNEELGNEQTTKSKLLKAKHVYGVSRHPDSSLWINNKKISRQNGELIVGGHSENDVSNAALVPTLSLRNNRGSALKITRGDDALSVNPDSILELETGDVVYFTGSITAIVTWDPKICFYTQTDDMPTFDLTACASIGLKLVTKHSRDVTHHLTPKLIPPLAPSVLLSLLNPSRLVSPEWLAELIARGTDSNGLEKTCDLPLERNYRPLPDPTLTVEYPSMSKPSAWDPSRRRKALFEGIRFIFAVVGSGAGSAAKTVVEVVSRGGGDRQLVNVEKEAQEQAKGAGGTWVTVLKKRKTFVKEGMGSGLVLVGEDEAMSATAEIRDAWKVMLEKARSVNMRVVHPSLISEAILKADVSVLDCSVDVDAEVTSHFKSLPDYIPSTLPEEPSQPPPTAPTRRSGVAEASQTTGAGPSRRLTRRATSQTPLPESAPAATPIEVDDEKVVPAPKKPLKRRAKTGAKLVHEILGLDDSTMLDASQSQSQLRGVEAPVAVAQVSVPPTPARPGRLKRRAGTAAASQIFPDLQSATLEDGEEPPLKKFKALFEESGHGEIDQAEGSGSGGISGTSLPAVEEEEEEESHAGTQTKKRKAQSMEEEEERDPDVEMRDAEGTPAPKRQAIENVNAVKPLPKTKPPATMKPTSRTTVILKGGAKGTEAGKTRGAAPGKPDTDPSFLRAIASTKRGKKTEDEFDREFNKLRIAKPDTANVNTSTADAAVLWEKEWDALGDFERDVGIRGNFMQVVEVEVWKDVRQDPPGLHTRRDSSLAARIDWNGREDFKKFKRKMNVQPREPVQLMVSEQRDDAIGASYWESTADKRVKSFDEMTQSQDHSQSLPKFTQKQLASTGRSKAQPKSKHKSKAVVSDDEVEDELGDTGRKGKSKSRAAGAGKGKASKKPLFDIGSDEDEDIGADLTTGGMPDDNEDVDMTLRSTQKVTRSPKEKGRGTKRKAIVVEDSDSDGGLTFGGFAKKAKMTGKSKETR